MQLANGEAKQSPDITSDWGGVMYFLNKAGMVLVSICETSNLF
jgi:hypothetical protein